jgi:hypothetical protein
MIANSFTAKIRHIGSIQLTTGIFLETVIPTGRLPAWPPLLPRPSITTEQLSAACGHLHDVTAEQIAAAVGSVPQGWRITMDEQIALCTYLEKRRIELITVYPKQVVGAKK